MVIQDETAQRLAIRYSELCIKVDKYKNRKDPFDRERSEELRESISTAMNELSKIIDTCEVQTRFPEIYQTYKGADNIVNPSSFTSQ
jgi:hypothetical protein